MDEAIRCLNLANKWIDYGKSHPEGNKFHLKGRGLGHMIVFG